MFHNDDQMGEVSLAVERMAATWEEEAAANQMRSDLLYGLAYCQF